MADNLPLIPKKDTVCSDVRTVLRDVFREYDYLPPVAEEALPRENDEPILPKLGQWIDKFSKESEELWKTEQEMKECHAKRIARQPLPNIYKLSANPKTSLPTWTIKHGIITRKDLVPSINQNAVQDKSLWVQNILNRSSCDVSCVEVVGSRINMPLLLMPADDETLQSLSIGEIVPRKPPPTAPASLPPPPPEYIICIPPELEFVNFSVGRTHTQTVRLVNVSKFEIRLSVKPPRRSELIVSLGKRGLGATAGANVKLRVNFTARDVRAVTDCLWVTASSGQQLVLPIRCYMQPPILDVIISMVTCSSLSCMGSATPTSTNDVIELGARLLGDVHSVDLLLHCPQSHAAFFLLTEDAWLSFYLDTLTRSGALLCGEFSVQPVWWRGGGCVAGRVTCRARAAGTHCAALRLLTHTATRPLHLLADALHYQADHVTIQAQDKDYDICSEDDPACEYYVHLGTAFPNRSLSATVQLVNHSPLVYSYYWSVRPWGVCSCWQDRDQEDSNPSDSGLCTGAIEARNKEQNMDSSTSLPDSATELVRVEPARGTLAPRSSLTVQVGARVGGTLGIRRAVLRLILKDIPKESFLPGSDPMIVKTETVPAESIPGHEPWSREVCEVVCGELEVWWEVAPARVRLDPPILYLPHSRRIEEIELQLRATLLHGCGAVTARWTAGDTLPQDLSLTGAGPVPVTLRLPLCSPDAGAHPVTDVFVLQVPEFDCDAQTTIVHQSSARHARLSPARVRGGTTSPGNIVATSLKVTNDTRQHIQWHAHTWRWLGDDCCPSEQRASYCACASPQPSRWGLRPGDETHMHYDECAPNKDGCVATLIQVQSSSGIVETPTNAACEGRAALVAYRVLAPRLVLRLRPCLQEKVPGECEGCGLDPGTGSSQGTAILRASGALVRGRVSCYRLRLTNVTPSPTTVRWDESLEKDGAIKVTFLPNDVDVGGYAEVEIRVLIEARKVCSRRIFVYRASVERAYKPIYLLVEAAVAGVEVVYEIPLGASLTDETLLMRNTQKEQFPWDAPKSELTYDVIFAEEDRKRARQTDNICHCKYKMLYIPKEKPLRPPLEGDEKSSIEILCEPPALTRICPCCEHPKLVLPEYQQPFCLQFKGIPLRTDAWAADVKDPGVALEVVPSSGVLGARAIVEVTVKVYADCWGLYRDQLLIMIENLEPIIMDVWIEAVGNPLHFVMMPKEYGDDDTPTLWMSSSDPNRVVRVKNVSRTELSIHSYVLQKNATPQDALPFRLYLRFFDVLPKTCPCVNFFDSEDYADEESTDNSIYEEMDTGIEIYFTKDYGLQVDTCFKMKPEIITISPGGMGEFHVTFTPLKHGEFAPNAVLLLRPLPIQFAGPGWYRFQLHAHAVNLHQVIREGQLQVSDSKLRVRHCALNLPVGDVLRIRKTFRVQNTGSNHLHVKAATEDNWSIIEDGRHALACGGQCGCIMQSLKRNNQVDLHLPPRSSQEISLEVSIRADEVWPVTGDDGGPPLIYADWKKTVTPLYIFDEDNVLLTIPLILELEYPILKVEPTSIDFGFVTDGDTRKTYFSVSHTNRTMNLNLTVDWVGTSDFKLWPASLQVVPGASGRIYVQYTARWREGVAEGSAHITYGCGRQSGAGAWCRAVVTARAAPTRDHKCHVDVHDHTDNAELLPPKLNYLS